MKRAWITVLLCGMANAAQLSLGAPRMGAQGWEAPVILQPGAGESVASLQFDLALPQGFSAGASAFASEAATLAGKQAIFSQVGPGQMRVVIAGLNQQPMGGGQVAMVQLGQGPDGQAAPGLLLHAPVLASPSGSRIPVEANTEEPDPEPDPVDDGADDDVEEPEPETPPKENEPDPEPTEPPADDGADSGGNGGRNLNGFSPFNGNGDFSRDGAKANAKRAASKKAATNRKSTGAQQQAKNGTTVNGPAAQEPYYIARNEPRGAEDRRLAERIAGQSGAHPDARKILGGVGKAGDAPAGAAASTDASIDTEPFDIARGRGGGGARGGMGRVSHGATYGLAGAGATRGYSNGSFTGQPAGMGTKIVMVIFLAAIVGGAVWFYSLSGSPDRRRRASSANE